jgi:DNA polymerase-1
MGDKGDDVPGVDGVGPKRAVGLLEEYGSVFDLIGNLPLPGTAKYIQALNESKDQMLLSYQLMDLRSFCEEAIGDKLEMLQDDLAKIYGRVI